MNFSQLEAKIIATMPKPKRGDPPANSTDLLARMRALMTTLGNPEKSLKIIHIAGTSGKTSTCYYLAALLQAAGYKTGLTVSPDIDSVRERATIDLQPLSEKEWCQHMEEFFNLVQKTKIKPSYFEFFLGFAFWIFAKLKVDYVILETGLGGTWDGSNVATEPNKICAITDIGFDHMDYLGNTLTKIATDKAGIIHPKNEAFTLTQSPEAIAAIRARCQKVGANLHIIEGAPTTDFFKRNFHLAKALADFTLAREQHAPLTKSQITEALQVKIPARAEPLEIQGKTIIMDGSHNPQKFRAFVDYFNQTYPKKSRVLIASIGSNKFDRLDKSMSILREICDHIILTSFRHRSPETNYRVSIYADTLVSAAKAAGFKTVEYIDQPVEATKKALTLPADQIIVTGTFFLLKHIRPYLFHMYNKINQRKQK